MPLRNATLETLEQVLEIIAVVDADYTTMADVSPSPIGRHVRHIVDHLLAFREGAMSGCIDYNVRRRDSAFESDSNFAADTVKGFMAWLRSASLEEREVTVISEISVSHSETVNITSTINRELAYQINHTLHHIAYIRVLARAIGLDVPEHLGVAPATASYLRSLEKSQCAQ